jgi:hypothetical protein
MSLVYRVLGVGAALTILAGCGAGGGNHAAALPPTGGSVQSKARVPATFKVVVPPKTTATSVTRSPKFISPSTQSIVISVTDSSGTTVAAQNITTSGPGCNTPTVISPTTCSVTFNAAPGTDTFVITTYDQPNSGSGPFNGNILSESTFTFTIVAGQPNVVTATLGGVPKALTVTPLPDSPYLIGSTTSGFTSYYTQPQHVAIVSYDADNNPIVGTGAPALGMVATAGLTVTAPAPGTSQNVFTVQNFAFNSSETLTVTATPTADSGAATLTQVIPVTTKHIVVYIGGLTVPPAVFVYHDDNTTPVRSITLPGTPAGVFVDNQGDIIVPQTNNTIVVYAGTATSPTYTLTTNVNNPQSGCVDHESNVYVANGNNDVLQFPAGGANTVLQDYVTELNAPISCVVDADDSLWVLNNGDSTVTHFPAGSTTPNQHFAITGAPTNIPWSIGIDRASNLYIGYADSGQTVAAVQIYPKGSQTAAFQLPTVAGDLPAGTVVDIGGALWVGNFNASSAVIQRFASPVTATSSPSVINFQGGLQGIRLEVVPKALPTTE